MAERKILVALLTIPVVALLFVCPLFAADDSRWEVDDLLLAEAAGGFEVSPDGEWAVWVKTRMDKDKGRRVAHLYLSGLTEKREIQLTRGKESDRSPRWSPDGRRIAFLSSRPNSDEDKDEDSKTGLWLLSVPGGEPWRAFSYERSIRAFEWLDDSSIVFLAEEPPTLRESTLKEAKDTSNAVEDPLDESPVRVFLLDLEKKSVRRITDNKDWIRQMALSPDGRWVATVHERSLRWTFDHEIHPVLYVTPIGGGEAVQIEPDRRMVPTGLVWSRDSQGLYFSEEYTSHPKYFTASITVLNYYDLASRDVTRVDLDWERGLARSSIEATEDGFLALLANGVRPQAARYRKEGSSWARANLEGERASHIFGAKLSPDGQTILFEFTTASTPPQWYMGTLEGARITGESQLTHLNPAFEKKPKHRTEIIRWVGANEDEVEGILYYPLNYEEGKKYPLMLSIHGGPAGADYDAWSEGWGSPKILLTQRGAFVLKVNYHGSSDYGLEWVESICCGKYYELERVDLENGVDYLIERGLVDPDRLGTMGWSNGSILTTELITRSRRYKVASAGAGDVEWISDWGNVMFGASFNNYYLGAAPYEDPQLYIDKSPYFRLKDVTTPTIIYTGTEDVNVPPSQSWSHYRVMQQATDTPVRFILFPGEPHGLLKYQHQKRKVEEDMAWFDRYLFSAVEEKNPALKQGSPLSKALKLAKAARTEEGWGVKIREVVAPEVVEYQGIHVARFEVTRLQYSYFDPQYRFEPGTGDYPVGGVPFGRAEAFAAWLSAATGSEYRLPTAEDSAVLYGSSEGSGNTLDFWAGYEPNLDDQERLREAIADLSGEAPLLREVGRFDAVGEDPVFDLGGNVAEWTTGENGQGVLKGGSADLPAKHKSGVVAAGAYRGIRVIREH